MLLVEKGKSHTDIALHKLPSRFDVNSINHTTI